METNNHRITCYNNERLLKALHNKFGLNLLNPLINLEEALQVLNCTLQLYRSSGNPISEQFFMYCRACTPPEGMILAGLHHSLITKHLTMSADSSFLMGLVLNGSTFFLTTYFHKGDIPCIKGYKNDHRESDYQKKEVREIIAAAITVGCLYEMGIHGPLLKCSSRPLLGTCPYVP